LLRFCCAFGAYLAAPLVLIWPRLWCILGRRQRGSPGRCPGPRRAKISHSLLRFGSACVASLLRFCCAVGASLAAPLLRFAASLLRCWQRRCGVFATLVWRFCGAFAALLLRLRYVGGSATATPLRRLRGIFLVRKCLPGVWEHHSHLDNF
jgi:hypothetical protein